MVPFLVLDRACVRDAEVVSWRAVREGPAGVRRLPGVWLTHFFLSSFRWVLQCRFLLHGSARRLFAAGVAGYWMAWRALRDWRGWSRHAPAAALCASGLMPVCTGSGK